MPDNRDDAPNIRSDGDAPNIPFDSGAPNIPIKGDAEANAGDVFDPREPFDAAQHAMHGMLAAYFESQRPDHAAKIEGMIARITAEDCPRAITSGRREPAVVRLLHGVRSIRLGRRWAVWGGLAAAASLVWFLFGPWTSERGVAYAAALQLSFDPAFSPSFVFDAEGIERQLARIEANRVRRDQLLAIAPGWQPSTRDDRSPVSDAFECWAQACRGLRDIGRFDESLAELDDAIRYWVDYPHADPNNARDNWYPVLLADLGSVLAARGDFESATEPFLLSIEARAVSIGRESTREIRVSGAARSLTPLYWRMSYVALMQGNLRESGRWLDTADAGFRDYFAGACQEAGIAVPAGASALDAYRLAPAEFRFPPEHEVSNMFFADCVVPNADIVIKLREHLYRVARLQRSEGQFAAAEATLAAAEIVPRDPYRRHDGSRLEFFEPLEAARIAILQRDYAAAIPFLDEAARNTAAYVIYAPDGAVIERAPIAPLSIAEMSLLRGVALLGQDGGSAEGRRLVGDALAVPRKMGETLPAEQRERFLRQFAAWAKLANATGR